MKRSLLNCAVLLCSVSNLVSAVTITGSGSVGASFEEFNFDEGTENFDSCFDAASGASFSISCGVLGEFVSGEATLRASLEPFFGSVEGEAIGDVFFEDFAEGLADATVVYDGAVQGRYVLTGGVGTGTFHIGQFSFLESPGASATCQMTVNGIQGGCTDPFQLTFGEAFNLSIVLHGFAGASGLPSELFDISYDLTVAQDTTTGDLFQITLVPEPSAALLLAAGLGLLGLSRKVIPQ